jgi:hypothetical protein
MAVFLRDPTYPEREEERAEFERKLYALAQSSFPGFHLEDVDAGPSASIPGWLVAAGAVGWFIFTAPATIAENLPLWKTGFDKVVQFASDLELDFSIDMHDAAASAILECSKSFSWDEGSVEIIGCTRHSRNLNGVWSYYVDLNDISEPSDSMAKHEEACRQFDCRYIFLVRKSFDAATIIVDRKGQCEFSRLL